MESIPEFKLLDCTIRDGGYLNNWRFDKNIVREVYRALSKSGVDYVELGYRGTEEFFDREKYGTWRFSGEDDLAEAVSNINGSRISVMADFGRISKRDFPSAAQSVVDMVRVAVHKNNLIGAVRLLDEIKNKGYTVALNAMGYTAYTDEERAAFIKLVSNAALDYVYVADSYGAIFPGQVKDIFTPLLEIPGLKVGFHPHNSLQMAFANTIEAIEAGVHIIDSTIYGMGRAAGNLPTEIIISYLERQRFDKHNSIPVLNVIDRYFIEIRKQYRWGYQLPYMLSGMFQCHPDYARTLIEYKEYTIEDIWKAMEYVKKKNPTGFSRELLAEVINEGVIGGVAKRSSRGFAVAGAASGGGINGTSALAPDRPAAVTYAERHRGRNFLVLANGPTLKEYREKIERFIEKYDPVILGANFLGGLFRPDYHAFNNKRRFASYVDTVAKESALLIGENIAEETIREYTERDYEVLSYHDVVDSSFDISDGVVMSNCRTISVLLIGVAIVMGADRIFCAGLDGYAGSDVSGYHFYAEKDEKEDHGLIIERHRWCQNFLEQIDDYLDVREKEGVHILTPTSYKSFYTGIDNYI